MTIIGPRLGKHRAPISLTDEEVRAVAAYRSAIRQYHKAAADERRAVNENRSRTAQDMAAKASLAAIDAVSAALEVLNWTLRDDRDASEGS